MAADRRQERKSGRGKHAGTWGVRLVTKEVRGLRGVRDTGKYSPPSTQKCQRGSLPLHKKQHKHGDSPGTQASMRSKQAGCGNNGLRTLKCAPSSALHQQLCELESKFARMLQNYRIEVYINLCPQFFAETEAASTLSWRLYKSPSTAGTELVKLLDGCRRCRVAHHASKSFMTIDITEPQDAHTVCPARARQICSARRVSELFAAYAHPAT